jgi:hypothetical protein
MKVYILVRNDYVVYEYYEDITIAVFANENKANEEREKLENQPLPYISSTYRVVEFEVTV